jgi:hypothetical protein
MGKKCMENVMTMRCLRLGGCTCYREGEKVLCELSKAIRRTRAMVMEGRMPWLVTTNHAYLYSLCPGSPLPVLVLR